MTQRTYQYKVNIGPDNAGRINDEALSSAIRANLASSLTVIAGPSCDRSRVVGIPVISPERYDVRTRFVVDKHETWTAQDTMMCDNAVFSAMRDAVHAQWSIAGMRAVLPVDGSGSGSAGILFGDVGTVERTVSSGNQTAVLPATSGRILSTSVVGSTDPSRVGNSNSGDAANAASAAERAPL